jgi:hypothetical protein
MNFALVKANIVVNLIVGQQSDVDAEVQAQICDFGLAYDSSKFTINIGDTYIGNGQFQSTSQPPLPSLPYIPAVQTDWTNQPVPNDTRKAVDILAARLTILGG